MNKTTKITVLAVAVLVTVRVTLAGAWLIEEVDIDARGDNDVSIAIDSGDDIHVSYSITGGSVSYAFKDGSSWDITTFDDYGGDTSLALDSLGNPCIAYDSRDDYSDYGLYYAYLNGASWYITKVDVTGGYLGGTSIAVDSENKQHIAYTNTQDDFKYAYFNGTNWEITILDTFTGNSCSIAIDSADNPYIAYTKQDYQTHITSLYCTYWNGTSWEYEIVDSGSSTGPGPSNPSIGIDSGDNIHISYRQNSDYSYDFHYAYSDGTTWDITVVETSGYVGQFSSIVIDSQDNPHISYHYANGSSNLKYAYYGGTSWDISTVDTMGYNPDWPDTSITVDSADNPHIAYYDDISGYLKYAWYDPTVGVNDDTPTIPTGFALRSAVPNPNDGSASISFALPETCTVDLSLFDIKGRKTETLATGTHQPGEYSAEVNGLASGVYIYELKADEFVDSKKMIVQ